MQSSNAPQWMPDGSGIVFTSNRGDGKTSQLYLLRLRGGEAEPITSGKLSARSRSLPTGNRIAFSRADLARLRVVRRAQSARCAVVHARAPALAARGAGAQDASHRHEEAISNGSTNGRAAAPHDSVESAFSTRMRSVVVMMPVTWPFSMTGRHPVVPRIIRDAALRSD